MPYHITRVCRGYKVERLASFGRPSRFLSHHPMTKAMAERQLHAVEINSHQLHDHLFR